MDDVLRLVDDGGTSHFDKFCRFTSLILWLFYFTDPFAFYQKFQFLTILFINLFRLFIQFVYLTCLFHLFISFFKFRLQTKNFETELHCAIFTELHSKGITFMQEVLNITCQFDEQEHLYKCTVHTISIISGTETFGAGPFLVFGQIRGFSFAKFDHLTGSLKTCVNQYLSYERL